MFGSRRENEQRNTRKINIENEKKSKEHQQHISETTLFEKTHTYPSFVCNDMIKEWNRWERWCRCALC